MRQFERPLSPHLTVYKPQITSVLSITHRLTGVFLYFGALIFALWITLNVYGCGDCINGYLTTSCGKAFLLGWSWALFYHLLNGIRHLFWDVGVGYEMTTVRWTGWSVVLLSLLLTLAVWFFDSALLMELL